MNGNQKLRHRPLLLAATTAVIAAAVLLSAVADDSEPESRLAENSGGVINTSPRTEVAPVTTSPPVLAGASDAPVTCTETQGPADPASRGLTDLKMVSARKGFAVGQGVILVTDDGRHWQERYTDGSWFTSVEALDADHAWAVAHHSVLGTTDGGRHWFPLGQPAGATLRTVDFVDPSAGWGSDGRNVYRTTDGGHNWMLADPPCGAERICFSARDDGWAARDRHVFRTADGGRTWTSAFTLRLHESDSQFNARSVHIDALHCAGSGAVWVSFAGSAAGTTRTPFVIYRGTAEGSWTPVLQAAGGPPPAVAAPVGGTYPGPLHVSDSGSVMYTSLTPSATPSVAVATARQGGSTLGPWQPIPGVFSATAVSFVDAATGWVLGPKTDATNIDALLVTADGGRTWQEQLTRPVPPPGT